MIEAKQVIDGLALLTERELAEARLRIDFLLRQSQSVTEPAVMSDEEERFYMVVCTAVQKRGVTMPDGEAKHGRLLKAGKLAGEMRKALAACYGIAHAVHQGAALKRAEVYALLVRLALEDLDRALWMTNMRDRIQDWLWDIRGGRAGQAADAMEEALERWAPYARFGLPAVLRRLQQPDGLLDDAFPGYPRATLIEVLRKGVPSR